MSKFTLLRLLILLLLSAGFVQAEADSSGVSLKLKECYKLNAQRNIALINKAKALIPIANDYPNSDFSVRVYTLVGRGFANGRIFDSCQKYFDLGFENLGPEVSIDAEAHLNISYSFVLLIQQSYGKAEAYSQRAYDLYKKIGKKQGMSWARGAMANIFMDQKKFNESILYSEESGALALSIGDTTTFVYSCISQGSALGRMGKNSLAVKKYLIAIPFLLKNAIYSELALTYSNLASCYLDIPDNLKVIDASRKALYYSRKAKIDYFDGAIYLNLASANVKLGKIDKAVLFADTARGLLAGSLDLEMGANKYKLLAEIYNKAKIYDKALKCLIAYDSLNTIQSDSLLQSLSIAEENSEMLLGKDLEIQNLKDLQKKQIQLQKAQRRILLLTVGVSIFLLLLVFLLFVFINKTTKASKDLNEKSAIINQQFAELQRQNEVQLMTIGIVGHDLRGPLSTIVRLKQSMLSLGAEGKIKELEELLEAVFSNLEKILGLSNNLVDWVLSSQSGIQFKFEEVKIQAVADSIKDAFILSLQEKNLTLALDIAENASAYADLECVKTICRNLIQNAIKFTPENKKISMSAQLVKGISYQYVQIKIADEGIGIAPRILEKIKAGKNTFSTGTKGEKGSGLGLIMVQALLSMNKGTMEIVTEVDKGTTFELLIPAYNSEYAKQ